MKLSNSLADLLSASLYRGATYHTLDRDLITMLLRYGCSYYDVIALLSTIMPEKSPEEDIETLQSLAPAGSPLQKLNPMSIRAMIPRWTGTKYHTAPIANVVKDIQRKCTARIPCIFTYHSNLNPRNKKSIDDPYVLLVSDKKIVFLDINRKRVYTYAYEMEEHINDEVSDM